MRQSIQKFAIASIVYLGFALPGHGQLLDTLYYNNFWQLVTRDSAQYSRIAEVDTINLWFTGRFQDYTGDSALLMEGQYAKNGLKNGPFTMFYPNGKPYCTGYFDNDQMAGTWTFYGRNGRLREKISFTGYDFTVVESYDDTGKKMVKNGNGKWVKEFIAADGSVLKATGRYYAKKREGLWQLKNQQGQTLLVESYSNDYFLQGTILFPQTSYYEESKFTSELFYPNSLRLIESFTVWEARRRDYPYLSWLPTGMATDSPSEVQIDQPDKPAHYPLGMEAFYRQLAKVLVYPKEAKARKIEGKVYVEFIVGTDGYLYNTQVLKGIGGGCDQQAVIAVLQAGRWFPAQKKGFPVEQKMVIPISFILKQE